MIKDLMKLDRINKFFAGRTKKERLGLYFAAIFVSIAMIDRLLLNPFADKLNELDESIEREKIRIQHSYKILSQKEIFDAETVRYQSFLAKPAASDEEESASLLKEIEKMASESNVYVINIKSKGVVREGGAVQHLVEINCEGRMEQIVRFMYYIENADTLLKVSRYNLTPKQRDL